MIHCAIYARVSTQEQNLDQQLVDVRKAVEARGWEVVRVYQEKASAKHGAARPQWEALRAAAARREFGAVGVWSIDRMGRSTIDILNAVQAFEDRGCKLLVVQEGLDTTTPMGKFGLTILASVAQIERDLGAQRTRAGLEAARRRGSVLGRPRAHIPAKALQAIDDERKTVAETARKYKVSEATVRNKMKERKK